MLGWRGVNDGFGLAKEFPRAVVAGTPVLEPELQAQGVTFSEVKDSTDINDGGRTRSRTGLVKSQ